MKELFEGLSELCRINEAFYFSEQDYGDNYIVRSFSYRLASWTDFQIPYAKDSRGTAFVLDKRTGEWDLFCRAYKKFHNLGEMGIIPVDMIDEKLFQDLDYKIVMKKLEGTDKKFKDHVELLDFLR